MRVESGGQIGSLSWRQDIDGSCRRGKKFVLSAARLPADFMSKTSNKSSKNIKTRFISVY